MRKYKKLKIFIIIIISIPLMYFLSQKIPSFDKGLSLYEKTAINIYLKDKYPFEKFKIVKVEEYRETLGFDLRDDFERRKDNIDNRGLLISKTVTIASKKDKDIVFELDIDYLLDLLVLFKSILLGAIDTKMNYSPFYIWLLMDDNYEEKELNTLKKFLSEIDKEAYEISKKYFEEDEIVVYFDFRELPMDYNLYISYLKSLIKEHNIKNKDDFLIKLQNKEFKEWYFQIPSFGINIIMNNEIDKLGDEEEIKKYYDICQNISNEIINELNLANYWLDISIGKFNGNDKEFKKLKNFPTNAIRKLDRYYFMDYFDINTNYTGIYSYYSGYYIENYEYGEKFYKEDTFEDFKDEYYRNMEDIES